ncbi:MAG: FecR domain-containing protein [Parabacteroides sp.]|nr:FecR domain-containing protein [Parabacteroides sp.]
MEKTNAHIELTDHLTSGKTSPEMEALYRQRWEESANKKLPLEVQERMLAQIKEQMEKPRRIKRKSYPLWREWLSYAAVALICLGIGIGSHWYYMEQAVLSDPQNYVVSADKGQRASVILPDGTKVWLNSHTHLVYDTNYGVKERSVFLSGEAYFEVAKDTEHRFIVKAGSMEVEALGTAFNVKAYEDDNEMITTLFEGSVRTMVENEFAILSPDQSAIFNKSAHKLSVTRPRNASYARLWRTDELAFSGESLEDIAVLLNRMYSVEVRFLSNKIKNYSFSGVIRNNSLDNVFEIISLTAPITYESVGDTIYLNEK